ncbi:kinase-like domain-containing protein [Gymnopilus junonius]|uniref:non-specific serine/threonine protein kinase n=1 Tax=Gymnopilus junonius TaxID=109634 RepID=A0A9P5TK63_GYMJU|nr:kinase-like domain-containing protein [Gymnopilus junonius]
MRATQTYRLSRVIGHGTYALVFQAVEANSGQQVALKKSRVSQRVKRPILQYESRVLQLLQGHPAIPALYGYGQLPHFEYLAMDLLGPSIKECSHGPISVTTAVRVVLQMLSALKHIHNCGFVHRDIKPENVLCSPIDSSSISLIDYGISRPIKPGPPARYDPLSESKHVVGTLHWASLNAHDGIDLAPRDDLESLAYVAFFLLRGDLPWRATDSRNESMKNSMRRIRACKAAVLGDTLGTNLPAEFGYMLDYSRSLQYDQLPDYEELQRRFTELNAQVGNNDSKAPLDWSPVGTTKEPSGVDVHSNREDAESDSGMGNDEDEDEDFSNSYFEWDIGDWDIQGARDRSLTLRTEMMELVNSSIPQIVEVTQ